MSKRFDRPVVGRGVSRRALDKLMRSVETRGKGTTAGALSHGESVYQPPDVIHVSEFAVVNDAAARPKAGALYDVSLVGADGVKVDGSLFQAREMSGDGYVPDETPILVTHVDGDWGFLRLSSWRRIDGAIATEYATLDSVNHDVNYQGLGALQPHISRNSDGEERQLIGKFAVPVSGRIKAVTIQFMIRYQWDIIDMAAAAAFAQPGVRAPHFCLDLITDDPLDMSTITWDTRPAIIQADQHGLHSDLTTTNGALTFHAAPAPQWSNGRWFRAAAKDWHSYIAHHWYQGTPDYEDIITPVTGFVLSLDDDLTLQNFTGWDSWAVYAELNEVTRPEAVVLEA